MKKFAIFLISLSLLQLSVLARDYTKLQVKEMKKNQKYGTTQNYLNNNLSNSSFQTNYSVQGIKDPKIMKIGNYEFVDTAKYNAKLKADEKEYANMKKNLCKRTVDNYNAQAKGENYYHVYRIAERLIRANNLDYINWRIGIERNAKEVNAYTTGTNYININTALYDTFSDNDDALAIVIGHEMGHALLGHQKRLHQIIDKMETVHHITGATSGLLFKGLKRKYLIESKNAEYSADLEGAKLALKAGYNLNSAIEVLNYLDTLPKTTEFISDHPNAENRIKNYKENCKYFPEDIWMETGKYNIYNSDVLKVYLSSDRKSIVINGNPKRLNSEQYYRPEELPDVYARIGYKAYVNGEFAKSIEYFNKMFEIDRSNASAYLYASYACEALYKNTGKASYLKDAKTYVESAKMLEPNNKYVLEQINSL